MSIASLDTLDFYVDLRRISSSKSVRCTWYFNWNDTEFLNYFRKVYIFKILSLPTYEYGISPHKFCFPLIYIFKVLEFSSEMCRYPLLRVFQFQSVLLSRVRLFATPWTTAHQDSLSITNSWSLLKLISFESVMPSNHLILCWPLLPSIFPSIKVFSNESALHVR